MNRDCVKITLGEIIKTGKGKIQTGPFGSQLHASDYVCSGIPCVMPTNMQNNRINLSEIAYISEKDAHRLSQHITQEGDILYSRRGDVTQKAFVHKQEEGYFCGTGCLLIRTGNNIDAKFLLYYLSTQTSKEWVVQHATGATMPNLNSNTLLDFPIILPQRKIQQKITHILSTLDEKIENNKKIISELESMAKTLYDYWFVQFDFPDENGKPYKSSGGKMVYNEELKREIPIGWGLEKLACLADFKNGVNYSKEIEGDTSYQIVNVRDISSSTINILSSTCDTISLLSANTNKYLASDNSILIARSGIPGAVRLVSCDKPNTIYCGFIICISVFEIKFKHYIFYELNSNKAGNKNISGGTILKNTNQDILKNISIAIPQHNILENFNTIIKEIHTKAIDAQRQNQKLTTLRDWLLPMLMNGQVSVE